MWRFNLVNSAGIVATSRISYANKSDAENDAKHLRVALKIAGLTDREVRVEVSQHRKVS